VVLDKEPVERFAKGHGIPFVSFEDLERREEIVELVRTEIGSRINMGKGFKPFERIARISILDAEFRMGIEMTHTLKLKRDVIYEKYRKEIEALFK
jgi:long-chain acyl-CoA synthetase